MANIQSLMKCPALLPWLSPSSVCVALLAALSGCEKPGGSTPGSPRASLVVYCAAGLKKPVEAAAKAYEQDTQVAVQLQYGGTGTLLSQIRVAGKGDVFISADDGAVADARKLNLVREALPVAMLTPVIAVRSGNPKKIGSLADLLRDDIKFALANPESASIGKSVQAAAGDEWPKFTARVAVMKPTVTEIAADLSIGAVDAAILWDSLIGQFKDIEAVHVSELDAHAENASAAILTASTQASTALAFARYLSAPDKGGQHFSAAGTRPAGGDPWSPKPELIMYSGGVNRPAIEALLKQFADREGVDVTTVFNGCGILCATMKTMGESTSPRFPDVYYACDLCFVPPVAEHFPEAVLLTETDIGIVVPAGNPKKVVTLSDLAQAGLRIGLCNAEQSTLGFMTRGMLKSTGLLESIQKNVVVEVPTADFLVNQMRAGGLDAAIVYRVNTLAGSEHLEFIKIRHEGARAIQPFAVRADSIHRQLGFRLLDFLKANRQAFEKAGFQWRGEEKAIRSDSIEVPPWLKQK